MTKKGHQKFSALKWKLFPKKVIQKFFRPPQNRRQSLRLCYDPLADATVVLKTCRSTSNIPHNVDFSGAQHNTS